MNLDIPDSFDTEWLVENFNALHERIERLSELHDPESNDDDFSDCKKILNALSEYAGY